MLYDLPDWKDKAMGHTEAALGAASRIQPGQTTTVTPPGKTAGGALMGGLGGAAAGGAIGAALAGGAAGSVLPGWGTAIGALVGLGGYLLS